MKLFRGIFRNIVYPTVVVVLGTFIALLLGLQAWPPKSTPSENVVDNPTDVMPSENSLVNQQGDNGKGYRKPPIASPPPPPKGTLRAIRDMPEDELTQAPEKDEASECIPHMVNPRGIENIERFLDPENKDCVPLPDRGLAMVVDLCGGQSARTGSVYINGTYSSATVAIYSRYDSQTGIGVALAPDENGIVKQKSLDAEGKYLVVRLYSDPSSDREHNFCSLDLRGFQAVK